MTRTKNDCSYWTKRKAEAGLQNGDLDLCSYLKDMEQDRSTLRAFLIGGFVEGAYAVGGTLLLSVAADGAKIGLHDRELDRMTWRTADTLQALLDAADEAADTDPAKWRKATAVSQQRRLTR